MSVFTGMTSALPGPGRREAEEFAALLEGGRVPAGSDLADLVALTRALVPAGHAPRPEFRASLRERLVAEAADRPAGLPRQTPVGEPSAPSAPARPRLRNAVATVALAAVVTGAGAAAASTRALPGDVLYGLKRQIENVQLALAGSELARGRELLEQAEARLSEAEALAASSAATEPATRASLATALTEMERATDEGAVALTTSYTETGDTEPMLLLDRFVTEQQQRLSDLLVLLDPSLRARVAAHLDELERTAARTAALLDPAATAVGGTTTGTNAGATGGSAGPASGDGWAVSRLSDRSATGSTSDGSALSSATATGGAATGGAGDGGLLDDALSGLAGSGGSTGSTAGGSGAGGGGSGSDGGSAVPDTSPLPKVSVPVTGPVTSPLPMDPTSPAPLPSVTSLPTLDPTAGETSSPAPLPSVPCVPVPPLTSC